MVLVLGVAITWRFWLLAPRNRAGHGLDTTALRRLLEAPQNAVGRDEWFKLWRMGLAYGLLPDELIRPPFVQVTSVLVIKLVVLQLGVCWWLHPS